jgi:hypothetical protein
MQAIDIFVSVYPQTGEINDKIQVPTTAGEIYKKTVFSVAFTSLPIFC